MEKICDEIKHSFMLKVLHELGIEVNFLNLIKDIYEKHTADVMLSTERLDA